MRPPVRGRLPVIPERPGPHLGFDRQGSVALITLDDPQTLNALVDDDLAAIEQVAAAVAADDSLRVLMITGAGRAFCVGGHVSKMDELLVATSSTVSEQLASWQQALVALERLKKPTVAAINGVCMAAGASIALACDIRVVAAGARIGFPSVNAGLVVDLGDSWRLPRLLGFGWAKHLLLTGCTLSGERAAACGLATVLLPDNGFRDAALGFIAAELLSGYPVAQGVMKGLVDGHAEVSLEVALEGERFAQAVMYDGAEVHEARAVSERLRTERLNLT
jgi:enoyl-CoA hydratase/carnithine racemase